MAVAFAGFYAGYPFSNRLLAYNRASVPYRWLRCSAVERPKRRLVVEGGSLLLSINHGVQTRELEAIIVIVLWRCAT